MPFFNKKKSKEEEEAAAKAEAEKAQAEAEAAAAAAIEEAARKKAEEDAAREAEEKAAKEAAEKAKAEETASIADSGIGDQVGEQKDDLDKKIEKLGIADGKGKTEDAPLLGNKEEETKAVLCCVIS